MSVFKLYDCDVSMTYNGVTYAFTHVDSLSIEDSQRTRITRGNNAGDKTGIVYEEGVKDAKVVSLTVLGLGKDLHDLLKTIHKLKARVDVNCISRSDGSSKIAKNAVLSQEPRQVSLDDSAESMNVALSFESFDVSEVHKA